MSWDASFSRANFFFAHPTTTDARSSSDEANEDHPGKPRATDCHRRSPDELRSVALAFTAEKLNLRRGSGCDGDGGTSGASNTAGAQSTLAPNTSDWSSSSFSSSASNRKGLGASLSSALVDQAVQSATHTIVTDAIETLLHDEYHTKETYLKHSRELSRSSLPGVVPISKQLFEQQKQQQQILPQLLPQLPHEILPPTTTTSTTTTTTQMMSLAHTRAEEEAASAIVAAAIAAEQRAHAAAASALAFLAPGSK